MKHSYHSKDSQEHNSTSSIVIWQASLLQARKLLKKRSWEEAAMEYRFAFEAAEQLLPQSDDHTKGVKRYIRTAIEFAYTLRMSRFPCDLNALIALVKYRLQEEWLTEPLAHTIEPLEDISFAPKNEVKYWMQILFAMDDSRKNTLH